MSEKETKTKAKPKTEPKKETKKDIYRLESTVKYLSVEGHQFIGSHLEVNKEIKDRLIKYPQITVVEGD